MLFFLIESAVSAKEDSSLKWQILLFAQNERPAFEEFIRDLAENLHLQHRIEIDDDVAEKNNVHLVWEWPCL